MKSTLIVLATLIATVSSKIDNCAIIGPHEILDSIDAWGTSDSVYAISTHGTQCIEMQGATVKSRKFDRSLDRTFGSRGFKLHEGQCKSNGFTHEVYKRE